MQEIYQGQILELAKLVRLSRPISEPTHTGEKNNPICGDKVIINALVENGIIIDIHLIVRGCALCEAGAGLLGKTAINRNMDDLGYQKILQIMKLQLTHLHHNHLVYIFFLYFLTNI